MTISAFVGEPPATPRDYEIARGILVSSGILNADPSKGVPGPRRPPPGVYKFRTIGPELLVDCGISLAFIILFCVIRFSLRLFKKNLRWGLDDWLMIPGAILAIAWPCLAIASVNYGGAGKQSYDITYDEFEKYNWLLSIAKLDFWVTVGVIKMSITAFNMRLTGLSSRRWRIAHWTFFGLLIAFTITAFFLNVFQTVPASANFDYIAAGKLHKVPKYLSDFDLALSLGIVHAFMDFCLLAVPIIVVWKVQMTWLIKSRFLVVFAIGFITCISSILRTITTTNVKLTYDPLQTLHSIFRWNLIELTLGVLVANLPTMGTLLPGSWGGSSSRRSGNGGSGKPLAHGSDVEKGSRPHLESEESQESVRRE